MMSRPRTLAKHAHSAMSTCDFYDTLSPYYHLIYEDWDRSMAQQSGALDAIIRSKGGRHLLSVLDAACGIGTQSFGLAKLGYRVTASDISPSAVARAQREAINRGLSVQFSVADMRCVYAHHAREFDVVLACDNAIPHLLSDADILLALEQFYRCVAPGGLCLVSVRDYAALDMNIPVQIHPYAVRQEAEVRYILFQVWELHEPLYETSFYVVEHRAGAPPLTLATTATYYAVPIARLMRLMEQAGFSDVCRVDGEFFQPILTGRKSN
jgi:SAM-dependent methyltransferase